MEKLNTIYYGPAGTGKTHKMQEIFDGKANETIKNSNPVSIPAKAPIEATASDKPKQVNLPNTTNNGKGWDMIGGFVKNKYESIIMSLLSINNEPTGATDIIKLPFNNSFYKYFCGASTNGDFKQEIPAHSTNKKDLETDAQKLKARFTVKNNISHPEHKDIEFETGDENQGATILDRFGKTKFYIKNLEGEYTKKEIKRVKNFFCQNFGTDDPDKLIRMANDVTYRNEVLNGTSSLPENDTTIISEPEEDYSNPNEENTTKEDDIASKKVINPENQAFVTFHAGFAYEDFVQGLKPKLEASTLQFELKNGVFYDMCEQAAKLAGFNSLQHCLDSEKSDRKDFFQLAMDQNNFAYIFIDEINRGNVSKIFGELISLIEDTKRLGAKDELIITLPSGQKFGVPANLKIIGTMNTADKSLAHLDIALRRRFHFEACYPDVKVIINYDKEKGLDERTKLYNSFTALNLAITKAKNKEYQIGHAFFMSDESLKDVMDYKVIPLMMEYFGKGLRVKELLDASGFMVGEPDGVTDIPKFDALGEIKLA